MVGGHQIPVFYCTKCNHEWVEESQLQPSVQAVVAKLSIKTPMCWIHGSARGCGHSPPWGGGMELTSRGNFGVKMI